VAHRASLSPGSGFRSSARGQPGHDSSCFNDPRVSQTVHRAHVHILYKSLGVIVHEVRAQHVTKVLVTTGPRDLLSSPVDVVDNYGS
jgi:hypothetical protein